MIQARNAKTGLTCFATAIVLLNGRFGILAARAAARCGRTVQAPTSNIQARSAAGPDCPHTRNGDV